MSYESNRAARQRDLERKCRMPERYYVVSDEKLARDLKPRTLEQVYAENRAGRGAPPTRPAVVDKATYMKWRKTKRGQPHPASIDPDHPIAKQRLGRSHCMTKELDAAVRKLKREAKR